MPLALTDEQRKQIEAGEQQPAEVLDPQTHRRYVLVPLEEYETLVERIERDAFTKASARMLGRQLAEES